MSGNFGIELDPDRVFTEAYWGDIRPKAERLRSIPVSGKNKRTAYKLLASLVPKIVSGDLHGQVKKNGHFNPTDPDLSKSSIINMPGTVLISDLEYLIPISSYDKAQLKHPWRNGFGDPRDQNASTRHLLQRGRRISDGTADYSRGRIIYSNQTHEYQRIVSINILLTNQRGTTSPQDLLVCSLPTSDRESKPLVILSPSIYLSRDVEVGESYVRPGTDPLEGNTELGFQRYTSLEICMQGKPAEARIGLLSKALGSFAISPA